MGIDPLRRYDTFAYHRRLDEAMMNAASSRLLGMARRSWLPSPPPRSSTPSGSVPTSTPSPTKTPLERVPRISVGGIGAGQAMGPGWGSSTSHVGTPTGTRARGGRSGSRPADQRANRLRRGSKGGRSPGFDPESDKKRNVVERASNKLKGHRAVATRYDKRDYMFRGTIDVASIRIWLRDPVP
ncbi:MAG: hypothetical protein ACRDTF_07860 [Pseudonocardiaceae bacterium]